VTVRYSIWQSTANFVDAMLLKSRLVNWSAVVEFAQERLSSSKRLAGQFNLSF
jgi:hypothetical protein